MAENFMADHNLEAFGALIKRAKAVFLVPELLKGAFILGASGGNGLLLVDDPKTGAWTGPVGVKMAGER